ncbi:MAG: DedA family protein [Burkholderiaceae bacterium]|nr:MAG: DedA family protein [Burkholderiaceae bacterium]
MDIGSLIQTYGYWAVAGGTLIEGETVLLAAGAAASRSYLWMPAVIAIAAVCGFLGDQVFFYVGRRWGRQLMTRFPSLQPREARVAALLERHHVPLILGVRFMYGLRVAGPIAIGMSGVHWWRFLTLNFLGAVIWACIIGGAGYGLGHGVSRLVSLIHGIDADEFWLIGAAVLAAILWRITVWLRHLLQARHTRDGDHAGEAR